MKALLSTTSGNRLLIDASRVPALRRIRIVTGAPRPSNDVERPLPHFLEYAPDVLAKDAKGNELGANENKENRKQREDSLRRPIGPTEIPKGEQHEAKEESREENHQPAKGKHAEGPKRKAS